MVTNPEHHIEEFARAGADIISIHVEATLTSASIFAPVKPVVKVSVVINPEPCRQYQTRLELGGSSLYRDR